VIVDYFNVDRTRIRPTETDPILVIDPDAVLTATISPKRLQAVPGRYLQVVHDLGLIECVELPRSHLPQRPRQPLAGNLGVSTIEEVFSRLITEASDHGNMIARLSCYCSKVVEPDMDREMKAVGFECRWLELTGFEPPTSSLRKMRSNRSDQGEPVRDGGPVARLWEERRKTS
jgi:hypothetical protein